jgi:sterol desaturase/sphingolipid hydroxylase (fatty acid hydroxylase superfamily)
LGIWDVVIFTLEAVLIFVVSTLLFDIVHWLLHRWGRSTNPLLRTFARWHWVHHAFLDRKMRIHPNLVVRNIFFHVIPEYATSMAGTLLFLLVFPWQPVAAVAAMRTIMFAFTLKDEGMDFNHMTMPRVSGQQGLWWIGPSYHAMHHIYPNNFYSSFFNLFDLVFGTTCQFEGRRFVVTGAGGAFGAALVRRLQKLGAEVRTLKHGVDFAPGEAERSREALEWADVLVLSHGAKTADCYNANCRTFVELTELFARVGKERLTPPEVWALGSEAEFHGDLGMDSLRDYAASKRAFATHARGYYSSPDLIYRHIVPSAFTSAMGKGLISAETAVSVALFFIRRGFRYIPVTYTTLAFWNYFRFLFLRPAGNGIERAEPAADGGSGN